ncbi:MAG: S-methyl-5'-thioadenosine phosphorylase [Chloroflexi bacterium]|nr:S-methyl-5'-thioadenosine phosphorylase [Chloroflexota bacterium]MYF81292.1 S-methyl-5'-thioadenosine phosphorylase [Chloroflexota bacterium]MYI04193.1 S-methyl-5'-thioadenosine phosphorylase [Chloroflexota bacterium]
MTSDQPTAHLAVIGGSGFYWMPGLSEVQHWTTDTPFGPPSDEIVIGSLHGKRVAFLPRHGVGHRLMPHEIPVRANIWALKSLGVQGILAVSAVGSLRQEIVPGHMVVPDQIIDRTRGSRPTTFFGDGMVAHVGFADPFCADLSARLTESAGRVGQTVHAGGAYIAMEGPLFSTRAESHLYRSWGASIIGMTALPEAKLAREAEIAYAMLATATDYDVWHESEADVSADAVAQVVAHNVQNAQRIIADLAEHLPAAWTSTAEGALIGAIMTDPRRIPESTRARYELLIAGRLP